MANQPLPRLKIHRYRVRKLPRRDAVAADIVISGDCGAIQIRAVTPLAPIRERMAPRFRRGGMMGADPEGVIEGVGRNVLRNLIKQAAVAPEINAAVKRKRILLRAAKIAAIAAASGLAGYGGWLGVRSLWRKRRVAQARKLLASGKDPATVKASLANALKEDDAVLSIAASQLEEGEEDQGDVEETEDGSEDDEEAAQEETDRQTEEENADTEEQDEEEDAAAEEMSNDKGELPVMTTDGIRMPFRRRKKRKKVIDVQAREVPAEDDEQNADKDSDESTEDAAKPASAN